MPHPGAEGGEAFQRGSVAFEGGLGDVVPLEAFRVAVREVEEPLGAPGVGAGQLARFSDEGASAGVLLPAAPVAAAAQAPVRDYAVVADFRL